MFHFRIVTPLTNKFITQNNHRFFSLAKLLSSFSSPLREFPEFQSHQDLHKYSLEKPDEFWGTLARSRISWFKDFNKVSECSLNDGDIKWFREGKLNVAGNIFFYHSIFYYS